MKIYLYCLPVNNGDVMGFALSEDGKGLASHWSSNVAFSKHDMGLTSSWKHETYRTYAPNGFDLEWVDNPESHAGFLAALAPNKAQHPDPE